MNEKLSKRDKALLENLDRLLAGQPVKEPSDFIEDKILQVLKTYEYTEEKRAQEQANVARLMSDISHQIKTPLSALSLHLELAGDEALNASERRAALDECRKQSEKIRFLSENMFKAARLESGLISVQKTYDDIIPTILSSVSTIQPAVSSKGLTLDVHIPDSLIVPHDPVWVKEAILNILDNAVKYTESGHITVTLEKGAIYTRIDIADTGIGISPENYAKVFERFYRVRQSGTENVDGTGLGLSIAREILRQQGGNIMVSSNSEGCIFSLFLQNC